MSSNKIRVRFAPSPTGHLHIGGVRTALFNYLYARAQSGAFLVRIEDTDAARSRPEFEREITDSLSWLGLESDENMIRQSERLERYRQVVTQLMDQDLAYEEENEGRKAVRFRMPRVKTRFTDLVHGDVSFDSSLFDDLVIVKSDGFPTYHLACVIDDHDMEISHVFRGDDHLSNTPRQILLFQALGWKPPKYAHLPLILGHDGAPLSKRHGTVSLQGYREKGFLPDAVLNYLALLGWGPGNNEEFFTREQLIKKFSVKRITCSNSRFDLQKLEWLNSRHIKQLPEQTYLRQISDRYAGSRERYSEEAWRRLCLLYRSRIQTYADLADQNGYLFSETVDYDPDRMCELMSAPKAVQLVEDWLEAALRLPDFDNETTLESVTRQTAEKYELKAAALIHPLRFALTGVRVSPGLFELMSVLGRDTCLQRVRSLLSAARNLPADPA